MVQLIKFLPNLLPLENKILIYRGFNEEIIMHNRSLETKGSCLFPGPSAAPSEWKQAGAGANVSVTSLGHFPATRCFERYKLSEAPQGSPPHLARIIIKEFDGFELCPDQEEILSFIIKNKNIPPELAPHWDSLLNSQESSELLKLELKEDKNQEEFKKEKELKLKLFERQVRAVLMSDPLLLRVNISEQLREREGLNPAIFQVMDLISHDLLLATTPGEFFKEGLGLYSHHPDLSNYGNEANRLFVLMNLSVAYYSVIQTLELNEVKVHADKLQWAPHDEKVPEGAHVHLETREGKQILNFVVKNKVLRNGLSKTGIITKEELDAQLQEDFKALDARVKQTSAPNEFKFPMLDLKVPLTPELLTKLAYQKAIVTILKNKGAILDFSKIDLIKDATIIYLTQEKFTEALSHTFWNNCLTPYAEKLFYLATALGAIKEGLPLLQYFQLVNWLGHPSLSSGDAIPAPMAINLIYQMVTQNKEAQNLFRGLVGRGVLDGLSERDRKRVGHILRFNDGGFSFDEGNDIKPFYRNLVLTDFERKAAPHKLLFKHEGGKVCLAEDSWQVRHLNRRVDSRPKTLLELSIDLEKILKDFNNSFSQMPNHRMEARYENDKIFSVLKCLLVPIFGGVTPEKAVVIRMNELVPSGRRSNAPGFNPSVGNRI